MRGLLVTVTVVFAAVACGGSEAEPEPTTTAPGGTSTTVEETTPAPDEETAQERPQSRRVHAEPRLGGPAGDERRRGHAVLRPPALGG
jgi:hypothetical protein